jgi:triphosphatase
MLDIDEHGAAVLRRNHAGDFGRRRRSICEIELKLKCGQPALLFNLARKIRTVLPLQLGVQSKSERGYGLAQSSELRAVKAEPILLTTEMTSAKAL